MNEENIEQASNQLRKLIVQYYMTDDQPYRAIALIFSSPMKLVPQNVTREEVKLIVEKSLEGLRSFSEEDFDLAYNFIEPVWRIS